VFVQLAVTEPGMPPKIQRNYVLFSFIVFGQGRQAGKAPVTGGDSVAENHDEAADDRQVAKEEIEIENKPISETLDENDTEESADGEFGEAFGNNGSRTSQHGLDVGYGTC
jgi:hypothetical protein